MTTKEVFVIIDWLNQEVLGVYSTEENAKKSLIDPELGEFDADIIKEKLRR